MPKTSPHPDQATFTRLLADPTVRMVMKADRVTEHQLLELIDIALSKLGAESEP
jgi:hypothetical protein